MIARPKEELRANVNGAFLVRAEMDWRIPVEVQLLLVVLRLRLDVAPAQRVPVNSGNFAALRFRVNVIRICRVFKYPKTVTTVNVFPARISDAAGIRRIAHPNAVVLQAPVNVIWLRVVYAHVIELGRWQVPGAGPAGAPVSAAPESAIVTGINLIGIAWINPDGVI